MDRPKEEEMGAYVRGMQARRVMERLPEALQQPIVRLLLCAYEDGDGTLDGVIEATPRGMLQGIRDFLRDLDTGLRKAGGEDIEELYDDLSGRLDDELARPDRVIDGCVPVPVIAPARWREG